MKVALINFSGNVGKTTIAKYVLQRKMKCEVYAVETINETDADSVKIDSNEFSDLQMKLLIEDDLIVDIGSSNVESLLEQITKYQGSQDDFDYYVIPVIPETKQIVDTAQTIYKLVSELNVPTSKIKIIFNKVIETNAEKTKEKFLPIYALLEKLNIKENVASVYETTYFSDARTLITYNLLPTGFKGDVLDLDFMSKSHDDFKKLVGENLKKVKEAQNPDEAMQLRKDAERYSGLVTLSRLSKPVVKNLDEAFEQLFLNKTKNKK